MNLKDYESAFIKTKKLGENMFLDTIRTNMPDYVKNNSEYLKLPKNKIFINKSDPVKYAYIVIYGDLVVVNEFESGKTFEPVKLYQSDFIGVVEVLLDYEEFISTVQCSTAVEFIRIPKKQFIRWLKDSNTISNLVLRSVCMNFSQSMTESGKHILLDSMYLFINHILKNASLTSNKTLYILNETRQKSAIRTGINLRTLYRYVNKLKDMNYISIYNQHIGFSESQKTKLIDFSLSLRDK